MKPEFSTDVFCINVWLKKTNCISFYAFQWTLFSVLKKLFKNKYIQKICLIFTRVVRKTFRQWMAVYLFTLVPHHSQVTFSSKCLVHNLHSCKINSSKFSCRTWLHLKFCPLKEEKGFSAESLFRMSLKEMLMVKTFLLLLTM